MILKNENKYKWKKTDREKVLFFCNCKWKKKIIVGEKYDFFYI